MDIVVEAITLIDTNSKASVRGPETPQPKKTDPQPKNVIWTTLSRKKSALSRFLLADGTINFG